MQVSALNTIIAAQQARTTASAARSNPAPTPPSASASPAPPAASKQPDVFAPLAFAEAGNAPATTAPRSAANPFTAPVPLGSQIDIRV